MDFLLSNDVDFSYDQSDSTYVATIKIINKPEEMPQTAEYDIPKQEVVSGMDQMRQFQNGRNGSAIEQHDQVQLLQN